MPKPRSSPTPDPVSARIEQAILSAGISKAELARRLRVDRARISRWCSPNYHGHTLSTLRAIAERLGLEVEVRFIERTTK